MTRAIAALVDGTPDSISIDDRGVQYGHGMFETYFDTELGATVRICQMRLALQSALAGLKHLNRLEQVLARSEWSDSYVVEGLMCDVEGRLVEATAMNV